MSLSKKAIEVMELVYKALSEYEEVILTEEEFNDEDNEIRYEAPRVSKVSKYFNYDEYVIISISNGNYKALGVTEGVEAENIEGSLAELTYGEAVNLLGWLNN